MLAGHGQLGHNQAVASLEPLSEPATVALLASVDILEAQENKSLARVRSGYRRQLGDRLVTVTVETVAVDAGHFGGADAVAPEAPFPRRQLLHFLEFAVTPELRFADRDPHRDAVFSAPRLVATGRDPGLRDDVEIINEPVHLDILVEVAGLQT